jgi:Na+-transporting NADH:ubiquinone oxidoreductase subunit NqrB
VNVDRSFIAGFLVLGFAILIAGFLLGMAAIAVIPMSLDATTVGFILFILGFITGMLTIALILVTAQFIELKRKSP